jgi:acetyltransferase-like isoleucine patch superfamily enzyme
LLVDSFIPEERTALRAVHVRGAPRPSAFARFGAASWIVPPATVEGAGDIAVGANVVVLESSVLRVLGESTNHPRIVLGDGVRLTRFVSITCEVGVTIGNRVASSDNVAITDTWRLWPGAPASPPFPAAPIVIGDGAYLGCNSIVTPGVTIGEGAFVGEGAVVWDDVPPHTVVYGNPARVYARHDPATGWQEDRL